MHNSAIISIQERLKGYGFSWRSVQVSIFYIGGEPCLGILPRSNLPFASQLLLALSDFPVSTTPCGQRHEFVLVPTALMEMGSFQEKTLLLPRTWLWCLLLKAPVKFQLSPKQGALSSSFYLCKRCFSKPLVCFAPNLWTYWPQDLYREKRNSPLWSNLLK